MAQDSGGGGGGGGYKFDTSIAATQTATLGTKVTTTVGDIIAGGGKSPKWILPVALVCIVGVVVLGIVWILNRK